MLFGFYSEEFRNSLTEKKKKNQRNSEKARIIYKKNYLL